MYKLSIKIEDTQKNCTKFTGGRQLMVLNKGAKKIQGNPAVLFNAIHKILQSCYFQYFRYIYLNKLI